MMSSTSKILVLVVLGAAGLAGCEGGCDVGETWCEDDLVIECVYDPDDEDDYEDDGDCGFLCALIDLADDLSDGDSYPEVLFDCAPAGKTCQEGEDEDGYSYAECGFRDFDDYAR
jgi:hypothetical protein